MANTKPNPHAGRLHYHWYGPDIYSTSTDRGVLMFFRESDVLFECSTAYVLTEAALANSPSYWAPAFNCVCYLEYHADASVTKHGSLADD